MITSLFKQACATFRLRTCIYPPPHYQTGRAILRTSCERKFTNTREMATFNLPNGDSPCPVNLPDDLTEAQLMGYKPFTRWISTLQKSLKSQSNSDHPFHSSPYKLRGIKIQ